MTDKRDSGWGAGNRIAPDDQAEMAAAEAERLFLGAFEEFYRAGLRLADRWDGPGFNADERFPLPDRLRPPMSLDEWMHELSEHYARIEGRTR